MFFKNINIKKIVGLVGSAKKLTDGKKTAVGAGGIVLKGIMDGSIDLEKMINDPVYLGLVILSCVGVIDKIIKAIRTMIGKR